MPKTTPLTPENFRDVLNRMPGALQHGFVTGFSQLFISQSKAVSPPASETDAMFYLKLDIEPNTGSDIMILYIRFEPEQSAYAPVRYSHRNGNASKPVSHYAGIMDLLRSAASSARRVEVFLQVNENGQNSLVML